MSKLQGKVAVITGGNSGIGLATAKLFHQEGASVVITGRNQATLNTAVSTIGTDTLAIQADMANLPAIDALFEQVRERYGRIDVLFLNAGIAKFVPLEGVTEAIYDEMMDINLKGVYFSVQKALPLLAEGTSIILNTSVVNQMGAPTASVYAASKAGIRSLARTLSAELAERKIRVNALSPGPVDTPIFDKLALPADAVQGMREGFRQMVPMQRFGTANEIAQAALFLASPESSSFILGSELVVDGGMSQL